MNDFIQENAAVFRVFASRYARDADMVDDVLQEAYIKLWTRRERIGVVRSPRNYFFTMIKHAFLDHRDDYEREGVEHGLDGCEEVSDDDSLLQHILEAETSDLIARAIMKLSDKSQQVILMSLDGESMKDIAKELGVTVNTVKTVKYRALERLSGLLSREDLLLIMGAVGCGSDFF